MKVESKWLYEPVVVQDFPYRGKKLERAPARSRMRTDVSRDWKLCRWRLHDA